MTPNTTNADKEDGAKPLPSSQFWVTQLYMAKSDHKDFWDYGKKVEQRYKNAKDAAQKHNRGKKLQILYSNTETIKSSLYARTAKPDVRQRFTQQKNELARTAGDVLERTLSYCADTTHHDRAFRKGVHDLVLPGRGVVWVEYEPVLGKDEGGQEIIVDQKVDDCFVYYRDFLHSPAKSWSEVWWIARRKLMTRDDMKDAGFEAWDKIPLNWAPDMEQRDKEVPEALKRAEVWEIWHKSKKERIFVVEGHPQVARVDPDPYGLQGFWPCAEPCQALTCNDTFVPTSLFVQYEDQADDLDEITERISKLTRALKRRGIYDASVKELKRLSKAGDNEFIPSESFAQFAAAGGLKGAFQTEDLKPIADALLGLYQQRDQLIQAIYEITGISDIMRGSSDATETLGAQQLKAQFGSARIKTMQQDVQRWIRDTLRIKAELVAEHYEPQTFLAITGLKLETEAERQAREAQEMAQKMQEWQMQAQQAMKQGQPPPPQPQPEQEDPNDDPTIDAVVALLRDDKLRSYQIDVETDSTIFQDAEQEKASRTELLTAMAGFVQQWAPVSMGSPPMMKLGFDMLEFGVRGFQQGRHLEEALEEAREALIEQMEQQAQQPPPPDPAAIELKMKEEAHQQDMRHKDEEHQQKIAMQNQQLEMDFTNNNAKLMETAAAKGIDPNLMLKASPKAQQANTAQMQEILNALQGVARMASAPKRVVRDMDGRVVGIEPTVLN